MLLGDKTMGDRSGAPRGEDPDGLSQSTEPRPIIPHAQNAAYFRGHEVHIRFAVK